MVNPHAITKQFEQALCDYTGAPYAVAVDNQSNALFLALMYARSYLFVDGGKDFKVNSGGYGYARIPKHTYPSVPCEVVHAGIRPEFVDSPPILKGEYQLWPYPIFDSALRFTADMYRPGMLQCLSFTGPYKHLKLTKGGAILTDDEEAYKWFKKARFSGRGECSYHEDNFDDNPVIGWNMYMIPEIAARGVQMMAQFYNLDGTRKHNEDLSLPYPDLSKFNLWK
jgi:dTDP-4-amino-4,6-dideoxygalactose transaminase